MRVSMLQDNLTNALKLVGKTVGKKARFNPLVLESVKISTYAGRVYVETSDLETAVRVSKGAMIESDGAVCVPYKEFAKFVDRLSPERLDMEFIPRSLSLALTCGASKANFKGIAADEFPVIQWIKDNNVIDAPTLNVPATVLMNMISEVLYAVSDDKDRPVLNSVLVEYNNNKLSMIASDGFRMAYSEHTFADPSFDGQFSALVPLLAIEKFKAIFASEIKSEDDLTLVVEAERLFIVSYSTEFMTVLTEGQFPDYKYINFSNDIYTTHVDSVALVNVLKRAEVFSKYTLFKTEKQQGEAGIMRVSADSSELGSTEGILDAYVKGNTIASFYKIGLLLEVLSKFDVYNLQLEFKPTSFNQNKDTAYILKIINSANSWHILMPEFIALNESK